MLVAHCFLQQISNYFCKLLSLTFFTSKVGCCWYFIGMLGFHAVSHIRHLFSTVLSAWWELSRGWLLFMLTDQDPASGPTTSRNVSAFSWITPVEASECWCGGTEGGYCGVLQKASKDWSPPPFFLPHCTACRILVPRPGIEPWPWQWKHQILAAGPPGNSQALILVLTLQVFCKRQAVGRV